MCTCDFCEVAIVEDGEVRSAGRVETTPEATGVVRRRALTRDDRVALEVTRQRVGDRADPRARTSRRVVVVSPADTGIRQARAKTDRLDARTLARLLAAG